MDCYKFVDRDTTISHVKYLLELCNKAQGRDRKKMMCTVLMNYVTSKEIVEGFVKKHQRFEVIVRNKIEEFRVDFADNPDLVNGWFKYLDAE